MFMKQILVSFLVVSAAFGTAKAQNLSMGPIAGFNHTWMTDAGPNRVFNPGATLGGRVTYSFNPHWAVGADLIGSWEGVKTKVDFPTNSTAVDADLVFLRLNPRMSYFFGELGDRVRPNLFGGTSFGVLAGGKTKTTIASSNEGPVITDKVKSTDNYNTFDAGLFAGVGINYRIGKAIWLNTEAMYNNGLVDLTKSDNSWSASRGVAFNVGVTFPIGTITPH
jgi:hypothetical protein